MLSSWVVTNESGSAESVLMPKTGRNLERIVEIIERTLSDCDNVEIAARAKVRDTVTRRLREHDILISITHAHHRIRLAIECRDRWRKVGSNAVESFATKCDHTGIDRRCIVSAKGFTEPARRKADFLRIQRIELASIESIPWLLANGVKILNRAISHIHCRVELHDRDHPDIEDSTLFLGDIEIGREILGQNAYQNLPAYENLPDGGQAPPSPGKYRRKIVFPGDGLTLRDNKTQERFPVASLAIVADYVVSYDFVPFQFYSYKEEGQDTPISEVAVAQLQAPFGPGKLSFVFEPDKGGKLVFSKDPTPENPD